MEHTDWTSNEAFFHRNRKLLDNLLFTKNGGLNGQWFHILKIKLKLKEKKGKKS